MRVLSVAAHPDDEVLGAGATLARHAADGDEVHILVICEGITMRYDDVRRGEVLAQARRVADIIGAADIRHAGLPDQGLDTLSLVEVIAPIEAAVDDLRPDVVYTHFAGDVNRDHQLIAEAVTVACRPYAAPSVAQLLMFETPSATEWSHGLGPQFVPNLFVDVTAHLERKIEAFAVYEAEVREWPHPRSLVALRDRARHWGSIANLEAAEPFVLVRARR